MNTRQKNPHSKLSGFTLVEVLVGSALLAIVVLGVTALLGNRTQNLKSAELAGEEDDLRRLLRRRFDCKETLARNRAKCVAGDAADFSVELLGESCGEAAGQDAEAINGYALRTNCRRESGYYAFDVEYSRLEPDGSASAYQDLFDVPFVCEDTLAPPAVVDVPHWCFNRRWQGTADVLGWQMMCDVTFSLRDYYSGPIDSVHVRYHWWGGPNGNAKANALFGPPPLTHQSKFYDPNNPTAPAFSCSAGTTEQFTHPNLDPTGFDFGTLKAADGDFMQNRHTGGSKSYGMILNYYPDVNHTISMQNNADGWGACRWEDGEGCFACLSNISVTINEQTPPRCTP